MKTEDILNILKNRFQGPRYVSFAELRMSSGYANRKNPNAESRIDFFVLDTYPSTNHLRQAYEIKASLQDYKNENKPKKFNQHKQSGSLSVANQVFYIAGKGIIPLNLIPEWAGLIEIGENNKWIVSKPAPFHETKDASWGFVSSIGRRINAVESLDLKAISDDILHRMLTAFYEGNQKKLNIEEFNYYLKLSKELQRRANIKYNKNNSDSKAYTRFYWNIKTVYPFIPSDKIIEFWNAIKVKKIRIKKKRLEFINSILTNEEKEAYKKFNRK